MVHYTFLSKSSFCQIELIAFPLFWNGLVSCTAMVTILHSAKKQPPREVEGMNKFNLTSTFFYFLFPMVRYLSEHCNQFYSFYTAFVLLKLALLFLKVSRNAPLRAKDFQYRIILIGLFPIFLCKYVLYLFIYSMLYLLIVTILALYCQS